MYKRMIILTYALVFFSLFATACSDNNNETYVEPILSQIEVSKLVKTTKHMFLLTVNLFRFLVHKYALMPFSIVTR